MRILARRRVWLAASVLLSLAVPARGQETQVWPGVEVDLKVNSRTRIVLEASTTQKDGDATEADFGVNLDTHLRPLKRRRELLFRVDEGKNRAVTVRGVYHYIRSYSGEANENRGAVEVTVRHPLTALLGDVLVSDRSLAEFRDIGGAHSWRYRNRLSMERELSAGPVRIDPFLRLEAYYDSRDDRWNRTEWRLGASIPLVSHGEVQAYFAWQNNNGKPQTKAAGTTFTMFF